MEHLYVIGIDYGTDSVRALLADAESGEEIAVAVCNYSRWGRGLYCDTAKSQFRQHPLDYLEGLEQVLRQVIAQCPAPEAIRAIAVDTTASTPCLVDRTCTPLSLTAGYEENPDAMFVLWKDHTAQRESEEITALCARGEINYARRSGNHYSSECFWSKVLHLLRGSERLRRDAWAVVELCDWIPAVLTGCRAMEDLRSGLCVAGSKMMWAEEWGGYPPEEFFAGLDPVLLPVLRRLPVRTYGCDTPAGTLSPEWAAKLGLSEQVVIGVGNVDCHSGAVGAGICHGTVVLNLGTSACYMAVMPPEKMGGRVRPGWSKAFSVRWMARYFPAWSDSKRGCRPSATCTRGSSACSAGRCAKCCCRPSLRTRRSARWPRRPKSGCWPNWPKPPRSCPFGPMRRWRPII